MARYIDADKIECIKAPIAPLKKGDAISWQDIAFQSDIDNIPAADVQEVKHSKWVKKEHLVPIARDCSPFNWERYDEATHSEYVDYWHCSYCMCEVSRDVKPTDNYCPSCGAKMDKE